MFEDAIDKWVADWLENRARATQFEPLKDPRATEALVNRLSSDSNFLARQAIAVLFGILKRSDRATVQALVLAIADANGCVGEAARTSLANIDPNWMKSEGAVDAVPQLIALLESSNSWVRPQAAITLGKIGDRRAITPMALAAGAEADAMNRVDIERAISQIDRNWRRARG